MVTIVVCRTAKARKTKWITRPRFKETLFFLHFPKNSKRKKQCKQSISRFWRRGEKDKFNVNNALICEFHFDSGDINVTMDRVRKCSNVMWFTWKTRKKFLLKAKRNPLRQENHCLRKLGNLHKNKLTTKLKKYQRPFALNVITINKKLTNF